MPKLPLTVTNVVARSGSLWDVTVAYADGSTGVFIIPQSLATMEAVTISALAMGVLLDIAIAHATTHGPSHRRYEPRS
jgi:hypothetical protein